MGYDEDDHGEELRRAEEAEVWSGQLPAEGCFGTMLVSMGKIRVLLRPRHFLGI